MSEMLKAQHREVKLYANKAGYDLYQQAAMATMKREMENYMMWGKGKTSEELMEEMTIGKLGPLSRTGLTKAIVRVGKIELEVLVNKDKIAYITDANGAVLNPMVELPYEEFIKYCEDIKQEVIGTTYKTDSGSITMVYNPAFDGPIGNSDDVVTYTYDSTISSIPQNNTLYF